MFVVRYDDKKLMSKRIARFVEDYTRSPDYSREFLFHLSLMVTMSHEPARTFTDALTAIAPALSSNPKIGGWTGSSSFYTMIMKRSTPIAMLLGDCGAPCAKGHVALMDSLRSLTGGLTKRLTWKMEMEMGMIFTSAHASGKLAASDIPWPTKEDSGVEMRDRDVLRPTAALNAVVYGDKDAVANGIAVFRNSSNSVVKGPFARAAYFAAATAGDTDDAAALSALFSHLVNSPHISSNDVQVLKDLLFGLTASASGATGCEHASGMILFTSSALAAEERLTAYVDMLTYATSCRSQMAQPVIALADKMLSAGSTGSVTAALNLFSTQESLNAITALLKKHSLAPSDIHTVTTNVMINIDLIENNHDAK